MRRLVMIVALALMLSACGEDTQDPASFSRAPWTPPPPTGTAAASAARWSDADLADLCSGLEGEFMNEPAPDRRAHADKFLRAATEMEQWRTLSVDERRTFEATVERALAGDC